ncbi:NAD(P)/FAD-dependent oxidoreductase [Enterococcus sp. CSURQ0835]|uniref:NAD(P)/FAD-dependent oxidoreductase n=1 Tax=Enterococcus sp. CSURQ0835 TaxID=2681394 RepID=UPI00135B5918|nr:NAD(P)/FAD-dependent oxidoreductase [Enterococcus sp. CSURQ0835]
MTEVVILGAGYAGLRTLKELQQSKEDFHITLVDKNPYHFEATALHEVAAGTQPKDRICYDIQDVVRPSKTTFLQAEVTKIDRKNQKIFFKSGPELTYDYLVVALGFESESFGIPGVKENALEMVDIDSAEAVYNHIVDQMNGYRKTKDPNALKIVVCGAGFTGIELLGSLVEARKRYAGMAQVDENQIEIYCVEAVTRLLPMFEEKLANYGIKHLEDWGIHFLTGKPIKEIKPNVVVYEDNKETGEKVELAANTIIWTTGVSGSHVIADSDFEQRRGRVMVNPDLTDPNHANVYIIGDVSAVKNPENDRPFPTTAQIALKMGSCAAKNIKAQIKGQPTQPFSFKSLGSVASIGNTHAFGIVGKTAIKGYPASFVKKAIMDRSLLETGGVKEMLSKGRFDLYH